MQLLALFRLAFASAPYLKYLTSLHIVTRRPVLQKVRDHTLSGALSACKHTVSGSLSLPSRGAFHLSLTVLYSIGHQVVFSLMRWSSHVPAGFLVSCSTLDSAKSNIYFAYGTFTLFRQLFQYCSAIDFSSMSRSVTPYVLLHKVWALSLSLATTQEIDCFLSFPPGTKMFQFPGFPSIHYEFMYG